MLRLQHMVLPLVAGISLVGCSAGGSPAVVRLVEHHCSRAGDGMVRVNAQLANDGPTGHVQASAYVLLDGGQIVDASGWQYEQSITARQSDFFSGEAPVDPGAQVAGCGVLLGDGAPKGVSREGDGADGS